MQCDYCFYCDEAEKRETPSYGMMSEETLKMIIKKVLFQAQGEVCFAFQGGEPALRGPAFFQKAVEMQERFNRNHVRVSNSFQTNGLLIDEEWCALFQKHHFLVGISVDGTETIHDRYRRGKDGSPTYARVRKAVEMLEQYKVDYNILTVVTRQAAEQIREIYQEYKRNGWHYQQYIACLDPLWEAPGEKEYSLTPEMYGKFLTELFRLWHKDWKRGKAPYIRQFENYVGILMGFPPEACEQRGVCSVQCVTEADGSVYPCDFYVLDEYRLGDFHTGRVRDFLESSTGKAFIKESGNLSETCGKCRWYRLCRGGCRRRRVPEEGGETYREYFCGSYRTFFEKCADQIREIAQYCLKYKKRVPYEKK